MLCLGTFNKLRSLCELVTVLPPLGPFSFCFLSSWVVLWSCGLCRVLVGLGSLVVVGLQAGLGFLGSVGSGLVACAGFWSV